MVGRGYGEGLLHTPGKVCLQVDGEEERGGGEEGFVFNCISFMLIKKIKKTLVWVHLVQFIHHRETVGLYLPLQTVLIIR